MHRRNPLSAPARCAVLALTVALALSACGNTSPTVSTGPTDGTSAPSATSTPASPTPLPTPTPVPTPVPTLPPLDVSVFGAGWTLASSATNAGDEPGVKILSTVGPTVSVAVVCAGPSVGTLTVTLVASGGELEAPTESSSTTFECPALTPGLASLDVSFDFDGVLIDPQVTAPEGVDYIVLIGTHG